MRFGALYKNSVILPNCSIASKNNSMRAIFIVDIVFPCFLSIRCAVSRASFNVTNWKLSNTSLMRFSLKSARIFSNVSSAEFIRQGRVDAIYTRVAGRMVVERLKVWRNRDASQSWRASLQCAETRLFVFCGRKSRSNVWSNWEEIRVLLCWCARVFIATLLRLCFVLICPCTACAQPER